MRNRQVNILESLRSVQAFLNTNADALPGIVTTGAKVKLDETIALLDQHAGVQTGHTLAARAATQRAYSLRKSLLRDHMAPIARISASSLPLTPELHTLRMPKGKPTPEKLRAAAVGMANAAMPYASVFVAAGLPTDFIRQLNIAADATTDTIGARKQNRVVVGGATKALSVSLSSGRKLVHVLDAFVKSTAKDDLPLLAAWSLARRVERLTAARSATSAPASPTPESAADSRE